MAIRRLSRIAVSAIRISTSWAQMASAVPIAFARRRGNFVREELPGDRRLEGADKVAVFVHYDRYGLVHDYVLFYLQAIIAAGYEIVLVSNAPRFDESALSRVRPFVTKVLWRKNVGYDFCAYRDGLLSLPNLSQLDSVILANDSVYGPIYDLKDVLGRCDDRAAVWGMTDSWDTRYHLQSYFMLLKREALRNEHLLRFWRSMLPVQSKRWIVQRYEIGFTQAALRAGLKVDAMFRYRDAAADLLEAGAAGALQVGSLDAKMRDFLKRMLRDAQSGSALNPTHHFFDHLLIKLRCPVIKRELIAKNPCGVPHAYAWEIMVQSSSNYDTGMIVQHLKAFVKHRAP